MAPAAAPCQVLSADSTSDSLIIGVAEPVDLTHAPVPATEAERFVFGLHYETVVRLDCEGRVVPALASQWIQEDERRWRFTLRENARFWDGTPVTAEDVPIAFAESLTTPDARTLRVVLAVPDSGALRRFADPRLAVARSGAAGAPPLGTASHQIMLRLAPGTDPRDLLDQGADLLVTDDPETIRYAASRETFDVVPLPWAWTYVFVGASLVWSGDAIGLSGLPEAVRGDVRLAEPPFWWSAAPRCAGAGAGSHYQTPGTARAIAYPETDPVARDLAGRLAALSAQGQAFPGVGPLRALGLSPTDFADALAANHAFGFITALPRRSYVACLDLPAAVVTPLLDARSSLVARRGRVGVEVDWDATPRLVRP